jgi:hypothetical protein
VVAGVILIEVIAAVFDHKPATKSAYAVLELFSITSSVEKDLLVEPA